MIWLIAFTAFMMVIGLMAVGVMAKRKPIQGSCGGLSSIDIERECNCVEVCAQHQPKLYQISEPTASPALARDHSPNS
ncbi:(Na+)-NQR maturation NqrM [Vibrio sp. LaRot3]|uniref:(Na+)-NQR maturation NqrM n=1 Tax=Vibrio sp. LaRot3 TaxID=2998829 RepID=UPI0022CDD93D|nr:(Na+)-NQR maturation NqrM [Vibrio sp. LaRot3]MDA0148978.1 (Na+)-NQR maturation NqrM [Vibrio sp. LaRot3]